MTQKTSKKLQTNAQKPSRALELLISAIDLSLLKIQSSSMSQIRIWASHLCDAKMQQSSDIIDSGITIHARVQDYDCVHTVFTLPLGNCILDFDLGYLLGIRDQSGGFEVDNGHTGKEENFCKVYATGLIAKEALSSANLIEWELVRQA
ncbi:hypothetical protein Pyn_11751 [Prunus yedoensis var. nudiflora]|uniref:Uncharacterized protein n=1 Tax=Prunus yedoensis var. nudiflora TaxID=2094558 RepID=A0A314U914_PRUYE|nr:hypothetical protein Pyn_11751 [Prunus yedoensis var. nudiflora]